MTNRLFIALKLPQEIREEIASITRSIYKGTENKHWEPAEKLHLTVKFLGNVDENRTNDIIESFTDAFSGIRMIRTSYDKFGFFLPKILWLGLNTEEHLFRLVDKIEENFSKLGFEKEKRKFKSHITLLRMKEGPDREFINAFREYKFPETEFYIIEAAVIKSTLRPTGSIYTDIQKIILHNGG